MLWIQLGLLFLLTASGTIYYLLVAIQNPEYTIGITGPLEAFTAIAAEGGLLGYLTFAVLSTGILVSGILGSVIATRWKAKIAQVEAGCLASRSQPSSDSKLDMLKAMLKVTPIPTRSSS